MTPLQAALYIVPTPLGNLADITLRAQEILAQADLIAAEDTRHTRKLCQHYNIATPMTAFHDYSSAETIASLCAKISVGQAVALVSDAGTPLISDPGYELIQACQQQNIPVVPLPGPCALICALSASGLATDKFTFMGFLPAKSAARQAFLQHYVGREETLICYESTHRINASLEDIAEVFGAERTMVIAKELTKHFEAIKRGSVADCQAWLQAEPERAKGEFVLLIAGCPAEPEQGLQQHQQLLEILLAELPLKQAVSLAAKITSANRNALYKYALELKSDQE